MNRLNASQVRLLLRLAAQVAAVITAFAMSRPAWAGAVGTLTAIEGILQFAVKETGAADPDGAADGTQA